MARLNLSVSAPKVYCKLFILVLALWKLTLTNGIKILHSILMCIAFFPSNSFLAWFNWLICLFILELVEMVNDR